VPLPFPYARLLDEATPYSHEFRAALDAPIRAVRLGHLMPPGATPKVTLRAHLTDVADPTLTAEAELTQSVPGDTTVELGFAQPFTLVNDRTYRFDLAVETPHTVFHLEGTRIAHETNYDDRLPLKWGGITDLGPWDPYGGIYPQDLNLEVYEPESRRKMLRMTQVLERAELLVIASSRQWSSIPRLPERYPMTARFYQLLLGCPSLEKVADCYRRPEAYLRTPKLGFEIREIFRAEPSLFGLALGGFGGFGTQASFTVHDHAPVLILEKKEVRSTVELKELLEPYLSPNPGSERP
jgi:hypothetical protein